VTEYLSVRASNQKQVSYDQEQTYFSWTHLPLGDFEYTKRVGSKVRIYRQHQEYNQYYRGHPFRHVTGNNQAEDQKHSAEGVYDVVNIEAIARPLPISVSRQGAVQTVAKPVDKNAKIDDMQ
jgi:hypothetical protein